MFIDEISTQKELRDILGAALFQADPWPDNMDYVEGYSDNFFFSRRKKQREAKRNRIQFIPSRVVYERKF